MAAGRALERAIPIPQYAAGFAAERLMGPAERAACRRPGLRPGAGSGYLEASFERDMEAAGGERVMSAGPHAISMSGWPMQFSAALRNW